ncbi:MAG: galactokinase [Planctomycetes bacterium]|nr:galactokinase [Planctomycetota bacterium]
MDLTQLKTDAVEFCETVLCSKAEVFGIAPGRVEVLGNHTDYNGGFVLSAAIDRYLVVTGRKTSGEIASVYSDAYERLYQFNTRAITPDGTAPWCNYIMGVIDVLQKAGHPLGGFEAVIAGNVPLGAGLSSSAALEVAVASFLSGVFGFKLDQPELARLCRSAENDFVGMKCGIMDQWSSIHGEADSLIFLDCRELTSEPVSIGEGVDLVLADTKASHELLASTYNDLQQKCFEAAKFFAKYKEGVTELRDVTAADFEEFGSHLPEEIQPQARHVIYENARVQDGVAALRQGDLAEMGRLMLESHASSRDYFGNSCRELDVMVEIAKGLDGCYGARLSGGGFGGCTVNLVEAEKAEHFAKHLASKYKAATGIAPEMHICRAVDGARTETA